MVVVSSPDYAVAVTDEVESQLSRMAGRVVDGTEVAVEVLVADVRAALSVETSSVGEGAAVPRGRVVRAAGRAAVAAVRDRWGTACGRGVERFGDVISMTRVFGFVDRRVEASHLHVGRPVFDRVARVAVAAVLRELAGWLEDRHEAVVEAARRDRVAGEVDVQRGYATVGRQRSPRPALRAERGRSGRGGR